eukprot:1535547-Prorocentrum_lima.AAC.1
MTSSLVGSEMCIRDSPHHVQELWRYIKTCKPICGVMAPRCTGMKGKAVSYTHLTLPTICSV